MKVHAMATRPTDEQWQMHTAAMALGSARKAADALGWCSREQVMMAGSAVRAWYQDSGYSAEYGKAKRLGFSDADARMRAEIVAEFNTRKAGA